MVERPWQVSNTPPPLLLHLPFLNQLGLAAVSGSPKYRAEGGSHSLFVWYEGRNCYINACVYFCHLQNAIDLLCAAIVHAALGF